MKQPIVKCDEKCFHNYNGNCIKETISIIDKACSSFAEKIERSIDSQDISYKKWC